jgi:phosphopantothenoylcysteine decarboxylase/phosphopantothenate--cysteine ligase
MNQNQEKGLLLGVCGSIAIYKACEITRYARKKGYNVKVIMTKEATKLITPLCFQALSGNPVYTDIYTLSKDGMEHINLSRFAKVFLIAPITANTISKIANGIADNLLTTTALTVTCPKFFAPAMNPTMYENPIIQENIKKLKQLGFTEITPDEGKMACFDTGKGKLASIETIFEVIEKHLNL